MAQKNIELAIITFEGVDEQAQKRIKSETRNCLLDLGIDATVEFNRANGNLPAVKVLSNNAQTCAKIKRLLFHKGDRFEECGWTAIFRVGTMVGTVDDPPHEG